MINMNLGGSILSLLHLGQRLGFLGFFISLKTYPQERHLGGTIAIYIFPPDFLQRVLDICKISSYILLLSLGLKPRNPAISSTEKLESRLLRKKSRILSRIVLFSSVIHVPSLSKGLNFIPYSIMPSFPCSLYLLKTASTGIPS